MDLQRTSEPQHQEIEVPTFEHRFVVPASVDDVARFHFATATFRALTLPALILKIHRQDPMAEGSITEFTLWMGPIPIHWKAEHSDVGHRGFTDTQTSGPMKTWVHRHRFESLSDDRTQVLDHIQYEHDSGWRGMRSTLLFSSPALKALFAWRSRVTRREVAALAKLRNLQKWS